MPQEKQRQKDQIKVTDKRIFTPDGEIREEFRDEIRPVEPSVAPEPPPPAETAAPKPAESAPRRPDEERRVSDEGPPPGQHDRRRTIQDKAQNPGTQFTDFVEPLIAQAYMSLGLLRNPYSPKPTVDPAAARQMIEIITMLRDKTVGNLTQEEHDFLDTHLGELKLAFVQRTKTL